MKKTLYVALFCALAMQLSGTATSTRPTPPAVTVSTIPASPSFVMTYNWYLDPDMSFYTGSSLTINQEIERLRRMWPAYTFSADGDIGLVEIEWGYFPNQPLRPIYSNLW